jgi:hypothetical protein
MVLAPSSKFGGWVEEMDGPLYLDGHLDEPLEAFFQLMVIYTHLEDHIEEPLEML